MAGKPKYDVDWMDALWAHRAAGGLFTPEELEYIAWRLKGETATSAWRATGRAKQTVWNQQRMVYYKYRDYKAHLLEQLIPGDTSVAALLDALRAQGPRRRVSE